MSTKRFVILVVGLLSAMTLSACSILDKGASASSEAAQTTMTLPESSQLLVGIVKLEQTDLAVTSAQAQALLPLWKATRQLSSKDSTAKEELDSLTAQVEETLTAEQRAAITDMQLGPESLREVMQTMGIEMGTAGGSAATAEESATRQALRQAAGGAQHQGGAGGAPGGGGGAGRLPGGGGGGFPGGEMPQMDPSQLATLQARGGDAGGAPRPMISDALYDALIKLLTERAAQGH